MVDAIWPIVVEDEHCEMPEPKAELEGLSRRYLHRKPD
jgi:hypothetical protein